MARINIEDDIESREEFRKLLRLIGGNWDEALGKLVRWFRLAQKHYGKGEAVPFEEIEEVELQCIIKSGWAVPVQGGYQAVGSEKQFAWYMQKLDASRLGGRPRTLKNETGRLPDANPPTPTPTPTPTLKTKKKELKRASLREPSKFESLDSGSGKDTATLIGAYCECYKAKFGSRPSVSGKEVNLLKSLLKAEGLDTSLLMVQVYLQMPDPWFITKNYDIGTLWENRNPIKLALNSGKAEPTKKSLQDELNEMGVFSEQRSISETN